jgi:hypothetical protein
LKIDSRQEESIKFARVLATIKGIAMENANPVKTYPPALWRGAFWAILFSWFASLTVIALSLAFSLGFGVIALFAGSIEGFSKFSLSTAQMKIMFWLPLVLLLLLYAVRWFSRRRLNVLATQTQRTWVAIAGAAIGYLTTFVVGVVLLLK